MNARETAAERAQWGEAAFRADDLQQALQHYISAVEADPTWSRAWNDVGAVAWSLGMPEDAVTAFRTALRLDPEDVDAMTNLAETLAQIDAAQRGTTRSDADPLLSVIVPTYERPEVVRQLLAALAEQDLPPCAFEVIVVDDGSREPLTLDVAASPFKLTLLYQENAGPAAARNRAIAVARAPWLVIFNDDAIPAKDVLRSHLFRQLESKEDRAVLGRFDFAPEKLAHPFTQLMQRTPLLFEYTQMKAGQSHDWRFFYTCNLSIPRRCVEAVGGFDAAFPHAICEDTELGYRLQKELGIKVFFDPAITALHDHDMTIDRYMRRQQLLGINSHRMATKHGDQKLMWRSEKLTPEFWLAVRKRIEADEPVVDELIRQVRAAEGSPLPTHQTAVDTFLRDLGTKVQRISGQMVLRGQLQAEMHFAKFPATPKDILGGLTSVVMPNLNGFPHVKEALSSLKRHTSGNYELIVVDNGSTDGSLEWLRQQKNVRLMEMGRNIGAPAARNRALENVRGNAVLFSDNDVIFTPGWHETLLAHLHAWPDIGIVGPMSDYVSGGQKSNLLPGPGKNLDEFAKSFHSAREGEHDYTSRLILFFMLCRRELIDRIGGIDERYGRWGFEDDDFCIRARRAGWQLRIAKDCFVRHLGSRTSKTANIDYNQLLLENWGVFKQKWGLDPALPYGSAIDVGKLLERPFDPATDKVLLASG